MRPYANVVNPEDAHVYLGRCPACLGTMHAGPDNPSGACLDCARPMQARAAAVEAGALVLLAVTLRLLDGVLDDGPAHVARRLLTEAVNAQPVELLTRARGEVDRYAAH